MKAAGSPFFAAFIASMAAGPLFLTLYAFASLYLQIPHPTTIEPVFLGAFLAMMVPATIVGFVIAFIPNLLGSAIMALAGRSTSWARSPIAWTLAGALAGAGLECWPSGVEAAMNPSGFALILTSAICARICRTQFGWGPDQA